MQKHVPWLLCYYIKPSENQNQNRFIVTAQVHNEILAASKYSLNTE